MYRERGVRWARRDGVKRAADERSVAAMLSLTPRTLFLFGLLIEDSHDVI